MRVDRPDLTEVDEYALLHGPRSVTIAIRLDAARGTRFRWWVFANGLARA